MLRVHSDVIIVYGRVWRVDLRLKHPALGANKPNPLIIFSCRLCGTFINGIGQSPGERLVLRVAPAATSHILNAPWIQAAQILYQQNVKTAHLGSSENAAAHSIACRTFTDKTGARIDLHTNRKRPNVCDEPWSALLPLSPPLSHQNQG
jgi:hypothetical protein